MEPMLRCCAINFNVAERSDVCAGSERTPGMQQGSCYELEGVLQKR